MSLDYTDASLVELGRQALTVEIDGLRAQLPRLGGSLHAPAAFVLPAVGESS